MTVAIGLVCSDGVLVAADSMASSGPVAAKSIKVRRFGSLPVVGTASGSVYVIEEVEVGLDAFDKAVQSDTNAQGLYLAPDLNFIRQNLTKPVRQIMGQCYGSALPFGLNQSQNGAHPFISDFLFAGFSNDTPYLLELAHDGQVNWHT